MNIAVIGGSGFIGTRLVKRLIESGHQVIICDKRPSITYPGLYAYADVCLPNTLLEPLSVAEIVINLAAEHRDDVTPKSRYDLVNVNGAMNVCEVCLRLGIKKIIFTSSVAVYGFSPIPTDESGKINYFNDYGRTKWLAEEVYRQWLKKDNDHSLTIIRPTVVFGEQNRGNVYNLLKQIAYGPFFMIGSGKNIKSMAYVENVAAFIEYCLDNSPGEHIFNYVDKPDFDMLSLVCYVHNLLNKREKIIHVPYSVGYFGGLCFDLLSKLTNKKFPISLIRIRKFCSNTIFESNNIKYTKFTPPISIYEGIEKTVRYEFIDKIPGDVFVTE